MPMTTDVDFTSANLLNTLATFTEAQLDDVDFGIIGLDADGMVRRYNTFESQAAGLSTQCVVGLPLFSVVAPCMNNFLVAQRFEDAAETKVDLDETIAYVLTLRMRPVKVRLRLLASSNAAMRYVLVQRSV